MEALQPKPHCGPEPQARACIEQRQLSTLQIIPKRTIERLHPRRPGERTRLAPSHPGGFPAPPLTDELGVRNPITERQFD